MKKGESGKNPTQKVAKRIKEFRNERDLRQIDMAESIGLSARHFQKIESGNTAINIGMLDKISTTLDVPSCYLLKEGACAELYEMQLGCRTEILDSLPVAIVICNLEGRAVYTNGHLRSFVKIGGQSPLYIWELFSDQPENEKLKSVLEKAAVALSSPVPHITKLRDPLEGIAAQVKVDWNYLKKGPECIGFISVVTPFSG